MSNKQELVEAPKVEISLFEAWADPIAELKELSFKQEFDITTYEGETACKKFIAKIGKMKTGVEKLRVSIKKEFLEKGRAVDAEAKVWQAEIAEVDAVHSGPMKALENKRVAEMLAEQELEKAKAKAEQDAKDEELEKLRAIVAEQEAEKQAAATAQQIEDAKSRAVEDAVLEEQRKAHQEKNDLIAKQLKEKNDAQAELDRIAEEDRIRQADVTHRTEFNNLALDAIVAVTGDPATSLRLVKAIVKNEIPNVTLNY